MERRYRPYYAGVVFVCAIYVLLRIWGVADSCLWFDEIFGVHAVEHDWNGMFWFVAQDLIHPPLFYVLLKAWTQAGGEGLYWLRSFPVLFSAVSLVPFLFLCRELKLSRLTVILATALFAFNGAMIKYAQEVRMYSVYLFLALVSTWLFARFYFRGKNIWVLTLVNVLMVYTHYFGWFVVAAEVAAIFSFQRVKIRHVLTMFGITLLAFVPWLWGLAKAVTAGSEVGQNIGWIERPGLKIVVDLLFDIIEPIYFQQSSIEPTSNLFVTLPLVLILAIAFILYLADWRRQETSGTFRLVLVLAAVPVIAAFILSWIFPVSIWGSRHLIAVFPLAFILVSLSVAEITTNALRTAFLAAITVLAAVSLAFKVQAPKSEFIWCAWEKLALEIGRDGNPVKVFALEDLSAYHLWFATRGRTNVQVVKINGVPGIIEDEAYFLPRGFDGVAVIGAESVTENEFHFAFRDVEWNEKHSPLNWLTAAGYETRKVAASDPHQGVRGFIGAAEK